MDLGEFFSSGDHWAQPWVVDVPLIESLQLLPLQDSTSAARGRGPRTSAPKQFRRLADKIWEYADRTIQRAGMSIRLDSRSRPNTAVLGAVKEPFAVNLTGNDRD